MQQLNSAKKSKNGKAVRRAVDMLVRSTAISPAYTVAKQAMRTPRKNKGKRNPGKSTISMCIGKMLYAGCEPFSQMAQGACIPDGSSISSVRGFVRRQVEVVVGTAGVGFAHFFVPLTSDATAIVTTTNAFTGTNCKWTASNNVLEVGILENFFPAQITTSQLLVGWGAADDRPSVSARVVAAGFDYRYTGKEIDRAGQVYTYIHPQHNSSGSMYSSAGTEVVFDGPTIASFLETHIVEAAREDTHIALFPVSNEELDYSSEQATNVVNLIYPWSQGSDRQPGGSSFLTASTNTRVGIPICTMFVRGTPGSTYNINYGQHSEMVGLAVNGFSKLPAESDPVGTQDLMAAFSRFQLNRRREPGVNPVSEFKAALRDLQRDRNVRISL